MKAFASGLAQTETGAQDGYTKATTSTIKIDNVEWNCWELDGTSESGLERFGNEYKYVLRGLLEGNLNFFLWAQDIISGETEFISNFGIIGGSTNVDQLYFSSKRKHRTFSSISTHDENLHNEIKNLINLFKRYQLPLTPVTRNSLSSYDFIF